MNEPTARTAERVSNSQRSGRQPLVSWVVMLSSVMLFASSLNCLFLWLAYGRNYDAAALGLSLALALLVYFFALDAKRVASYNRRLLIATGAVLFWAVFMPVLMRLAGYQTY